MAGPTRLLSVDGDPDRGDTTADSLDAATDRWVVDTVSDPGALLDRLAATTYDCVILADDLPGSDGLGLLETVRAEYPDLPVVLLAANGDERVASDAIAAGVTEYVPRTGDWETRLARRVESAVADRDGAETASDRLHRLQQLLTAVPAAITRVDRDGEIVFANERAKETFGLDSADVIGRTFDDSAWEIRDLDGDPIPPEDLPFRRVLDSGEPIEGYRHRIVDPDGKRRIVEIHGAPLFDDDGRVEGIVFANTDVTDRVQRETAFETLHDIATTIQRETTVEGVAERTVSAAANILRFDTCTVLIRDGEWLVPYAVSEETPPGGARRMRIDQGVAGETLQSGDPVVVDEITPEDRADPAKESYRSGLSVPVGEHGVFQAANAETDAFDGDDVEAAELLVSHAESRIDQIERESHLERQNERLDEFAGIVSHDLRNPLNVAAGRLALAQEERDDDDENLTVAADAIDRSQALIDDLLTLARQGETPGDLEPVSLEAIAEESWETAETATATLGVDADGVIHCDRTRLKQLFENLFRNAVEHGSTGSRPEADDAVEHGSTSPGDGAVTVTVGRLTNGFYVEDDGPGIPEDRRADVFDTGYSTAEEGNGFGLPIVENVVDAHDWSIRVVDGSTGGARFEITGVGIVE